LGASRIGHAVHAIEDPALLDHMTDHQIGVESSLTSNVQTTLVSLENKFHSELSVAH
jgi:adenosine deaminase